MTWIFFASVALFIVIYGKCRQIMIEAAKAKQIAKTRYDDTHTFFVDGRVVSFGSPVHSDGEGMDWQGGEGDTILLQKIG